jgi:hypothetical protein
MGAHDVVVCEGEAVAKAVVNVSLRSEVHDSVYLLFAQHVSHEIAGADVALDELYDQTMRRAKMKWLSLQAAEDDACWLVVQQYNRCTSYLVVSVALNALQIV